MSFYSVEGRTASAMAATGGHAIAALWNPSSTERIKLIEFALVKPNITNSLRWRIIPITARGTPASTVTPDEDNDWEGAKVPPSGALFDIGPYSVQPTVAGSGLQSTIISGTTTPGAGFSFRVDDPSQPIWIPPGCGIAMIQGSGTASEAGQILWCIWDEP